MTDTLARLLALGQHDEAADLLDADLAAKQPSDAGLTALVSAGNSAVLASTTAAFTTADETKLDGIASGATANSSDATLLARANHTGTQAQATITNLVSDLAAKATDSAVVHNTGTETIGGTKTFSSDVLVPDEAYDATAWDGSLEVPTKNAVRDKIETLSAGGVSDGDKGDVVVSSSGAVWTIESNFYKAGGTDVAVADGGTGASNASGARTNLGLVIGTDVAAIASPALTGAPTAPTQAAGDNSTRIATTAYADALVSDVAYNATTWNAVTGIAPSKNAVRDEIELRAPLASPALTGSPTAPTQTAADNSTKIATTAYVDAKVVQTITNGVTGTAPSQDAVFDALALKADSSILSDTVYGVGWDADTTHAPSKNAVYDQMELRAPKASPTFTGTVTLPADQALSGNPTTTTQTAANNSTRIATTAYADALVSDTAYNATTWNGVGGIAPSKNAVRDEIELRAPLASPALTGSPTAPTQTAADNSTKIATTAYADAKVADAIADSVTGIAPSQNAVFDALALKAALASPALTGTPTAPTAAQGTNTTQLATTAMVQSEVTLLAPKASPTLTGTPAAPTAAVGTNTTQVATTAYVQGELEALKLKQPVRVATTADITLASAAENGDTIDGVVLATGDRILVKSQSTASQNGIYIVAASGAPARSADASTGSEITNAVVQVLAGTANKGNVYQQTATVATIGTDSQTWAAVIATNVLPVASPSFTGNLTGSGDLGARFGLATQVYLGDSGGNAAIYLGSAYDTGFLRTGAGILSFAGSYVDFVTATAQAATFYASTSVELGHLTDTTLSRVSAGVIAVEGVAVPTISSTNTLTNKRVTPRVTATAGPGATPTINTDNCDFVDLTALAAAITSMTTNLSGTPTNGQRLTIRFLDNGTSRAITWGASYANGGTALPTATTISKELTVQFFWSATRSKWMCVDSKVEA